MNWTCPSDLLIVIQKRIATGCVQAKQNLTN